MASAKQAKDLDCGLCLGTYKKPKLLPCHHTYCAGCLEDLVKNTVNGPVRCPSCRREVQLPPGGVSQLQTNFYLTPLLNPERCTLHRTETLKVYCTDCKTAICITCRMTDHFKHDAQDLGKVLGEARTALKDGQNRLDEIQKALSEQEEQVQKRKNSLDDRQKALERLVQERAERLKSLFNTMVAQRSEELLKELQSAVRNLQEPLLAEKEGVEKKMSTVQCLQKEVTRALKSDISQSLLSFSSDIGSQKTQCALTSDLPVHTDWPFLMYNDNYDNSRQRHVIRKYLGHVHFQPIPLQQSVTVKEVFRCCEDTQMYVHAVCVESKNVFVAYGAGGKRGKGWLVKYHQSGALMDKLSRTSRGRVCLAGLNGGLVRVEGKEFPAKDWITGSFSSDGNENAKRKYDVYNKGDARFVLRVHESGLCDLRSVTITVCTTTTDVTVCEVSAQTPIAMDVSKDGQLIAVLEEGQDHVTLYRHGNTAPHAIYRCHGDAFRPLDVCFYMIGEEERLVIADWLNDVLHVVEMGEICKLIGHVGGECPELVKPTALCADREGRLWIGCQGGHVLTLSQQ